jgi:hypothetical protein
VIMTLALLAARVAKQPSNFWSTRDEPRIPKTILCVPISAV